jgi:hypothetical protein
VKLMGSSFIKPSRKKVPKPHTSAQCVARTSAACASAKMFAGYAAEQGVSDEVALEQGMQEKKKEFVGQGAKLYAKA